MHAVRPLPFDAGTARPVREADRLARRKRLGRAGVGFPRSQAQSYWAGNHTQACAFGQPLLLLDMYEHAYAIDYGAAAAKYVDAFFPNIQWDEVNRRLESAQRRTT